jgi:hypothetical protein
MVWILALLAPVLFFRASWRNGTHLLSFSHAALIIKKCKFSCGMLCFHCSLAGTLDDEVSLHFSSPLVGSGCCRGSGSSWSARGLVMREQCLGLPGEGGWHVRTRRLHDAQRPFPAEAGCVGPARASCCAGSARWSVSAHLSSARGGASARLSREKGGTGVPAGLARREGPGLPHSASRLPLTASQPSARQPPARRRGRLPCLSLNARWPGSTPESGRDGSLVPGIPER